jgi:hypothetical protein
MEMTMREAHVLEALEFLLNLWHMSVTFGIKQLLFAADLKAFIYKIILVIPISIIL